MKKILTSIILLQLLGVGVFAQESNNKIDNSIRLEMISAISGKMGFHIERSKNNKSFVLNMGFSLPTSTKKRHVFEIYPEFRKYFSDDNVMEGWYIGPHLRYRQVREDNLYISKSYGAGVHFGYQYNITSGFVVNAYFGPDYALGSLELQNGVYDSDNKPENTPSSYKPADVPLYEGVLINGGITLGIIF
ncbi:MAG: hypothetical protein ACJAUV_000071 [Flavobacteriales bacterium]|jgi:hypothetical protein